MEMKALAIGLILFAGLGALATGRVRHDLAALMMLLAAVVLGIVTPANAFAGFSDPVVVTVAAVMVLSAAIARSGVLRLTLAPLRRVLTSEVGVTASFSALCAVASAFMNNVGALSLLLPAALAACQAANVSPSRVLMPMAFASLLGGLITLIGTPPNVIIADLREAYTGQAFRMFDFTPVGLSVAAAGVIVMVLMLGLLPRRVAPGGEPLMFKIADYLFEARVPDRPRDKPLTVGDLRAVNPQGDGLSVHAIDRFGIVFAAPGDWRHLYPGDVVQLEGRAPVAQAVMERYGLEIVGGAEDDGLEAAIFECVLPERTPLVQAPDARQQLAGAGAALLAVSRGGRSFVERLETIRLMAGDVVLLQAPEGSKSAVIERFALLPLAERPLEINARHKADWRPFAAMAGAVVAASLELAPLAIALLAAIVALGCLGRINARAYRDIDWSVLLLLAALIPVANAFSELGAGAGIAEALSAVAAGGSPLLTIAIVLGATMLATPFLNNAAAVLIMAPIAASVAQATGVSIDALLMAVAVGASCDFLTPVGHQSNTLVFGPGGYRFFDYGRFGAPLSVVTLIVGSLVIEAVWA